MKTPLPARPASPDDTQVRVRQAYERELRPGEVLFEVGTPTETIYVVESGVIELVRPGAEGPRVVSRLGAGEIFGELGALLGGVSTVRATAVGPTRLLELDTPTFETMCLERPEIALRIIHRLASRLIELERRLCVLGVDDLLRPVVRTLVRRAEPSAEGAQVPITLREIAEQAGLSITDAHRAMQRLFERKLIRLVDDALVVPDRDALSSHLDSAS